MGDVEGEPQVVTYGSVDLRWSDATRVAVVRYAPGTRLTGPDGTILVDTLTAWIGSASAPFAVLAHAGGVASADAAYRARIGVFFRRHRATAHIAVVGVGPVLRVLAELFRVGTGIELRCLADERSARGWLQTRGMRA